MIPACSTRDRPLPSGNPSPVARHNGHASPGMKVEEADHNEHSIREWRSFVLDIPGRRRSSTNIDAEPVLDQSTGNSSELGPAAMKYPPSEERRRTNTENRPRISARATLSFGWDHNLPELVARSPIPQAGTLRGSFAPTWRSIHS